MKDSLNGLKNAKAPPPIPSNGIQDRPADSGVSENVFHRNTMTPESIQFNLSPLNNSEGKSEQVTMLTEIISKRLDSLSSDSFDKILKHVMNNENGENQDFFKLLYGEDLITEEDRKNPLYNAIDRNIKHDYRNCFKIHIQAQRSLEEMIKQNSIHPAVFVDSSEIVRNSLSIAKKYSQAQINQEKIREESRKLESMSSSFLYNSISAIQTPKLFKTSNQIPIKDTVTASSFDESDALNDDSFAVLQNQSNQTSPDATEMNKKGSIEGEQFVSEPVMEKPLSAEGFLVERNFKSPTMPIVEGAKNENSSVVLFVKQTETKILPDLSIQQTNQSSGRVISIDGHLHNTEGSSDTRLSTENTRDSCEIEKLDSNTGTIVSTSISQNAVRGNSENTEGVDQETRIDPASLQVDESEISTDDSPTVPETATQEPSITSTNSVENLFECTAPDVSQEQQQMAETVRDAHSEKSRSESPRSNSSSLRKSTRNQIKNGWIVRDQKEREKNSTLGFRRSRNRSSRKKASHSTDNKKIATTSIESEEGEIIVTSVETTTNDLSNSNKVAIEVAIARTSLNASPALPPFITNPNLYTNVQKMDSSKTSNAGEIITSPTKPKRKRPKKVKETNLEGNLTEKKIRTDQLLPVDTYRDTLNYYGEHIPTANHHTHVADFSGTTRTQFPVQNQDELLFSNSHTNQLQTIGHTYVAHSPFTTDFSSSFQTVNSNMDVPYSYGTGNSFYLQAPDFYHSPN